MYGNNFGYIWIWFGLFIIWIKLKWFLLFKIILEFFEMWIIVNKVFKKGKGS